MDFLLTHANQSIVFTGTLTVTIFHFFKGLVLDNVLLFSFVSGYGFAGQVWIRFWFRSSDLPLDQVLVLNNVLVVRFGTGPSGLVASPSAEFQAGC